MAGRQPGFALLEFLLVVTVIGILMAVALYYFIKRVDEAEMVALKAMSRNMAASMAMLRNKWIVEGRRQSDGKRFVMLDLDRVYLNRFGWPVNTDPELADADRQQSPRGCAQLWDVIMQNKIPVTVQGYDQRGERAYHVSSPGKTRCRYELANFPQQRHYFDYVLATGKVELYGQ